VVYFGGQSFKTRDARRGTPSNQNCETLRGLRRGPAQGKTWVPQFDSPIVFGYRCCHDCGPRAFAPRRPASGKTGTQGGLNIRRPLPGTRVRGDDPVRARGPAEPRKAFTVMAVPRRCRRCPVGAIAAPWGRSRSWRARVTTIKPRSRWHPETSRTNEGRTARFPYLCSAGRLSHGRRTVSAWRVERQRQK